MLDLEFRATVSYHIRKFLLHPPIWIEPANLISIPLKRKRVRFTEKNKGSVPQNKGIYCFVLNPKYKYFFETRYLFYVGKTNRTLRERYSEYLDEQAGVGKPRLKIEEMLNLYKDYVYFYYATIDNKTDVDVCEKKVLNTFVPPVNSLIPNARIKRELRNIYEI